MGAAPRYLGSKEACRLIAPSRGKESASFRRILSEGGDQQHVRGQRVQPGQPLALADAFRLIQRHAQFMRGHLDRGRAQPLPPAGRSVGTGEGGQELVRALRESPQRGNRELGSSQENEAEGHP